MVKITLNGERIEQVAKFCYLGAWITEDGKMMMMMMMWFYVTHSPFSLG